MKRILQKIWAWLLLERPNAERERTKLQRDQDRERYQAWIDMR